MTDDIATDTGLVVCEKAGECNEPEHRCAHKKHHSHMLMNSDQFGCHQGQWHCGIFMSKCIPITKENDDA